MSAISYTKQWTDDHLDLFNYAQGIGDIEWQQDILASLQHSTECVAKELKQKRKDELWRKYDLINTLLSNIYTELRKNVSKQDLMDQLIALKQQRLEISRQLASIG